MIHSIVLRILPGIARFHPSNKIEDREQYPQTWWLMPKNKKLKKVVQYICGILSGHEISKTEKGYGGGKFIDCNCRWCDKAIKVPVSECEFHPVMKDMIDFMMDHDGKNNP